MIPQFIWAAGLDTDLWILYRDVKYNLSVRIWLFISDLPRHGNLDISFPSEANKLQFPGTVRLDLGVLMEKPVTREQQ